MVQYYVMLFVLFGAMFFDVRCRELNEMNLQSYLAPWPDLEKEAGYGTGFKYRGGMPKKARDEETEIYSCVYDNGKYCLVWSANEFSSEEWETGKCWCVNETQKNYCTSWNCTQWEIEFGSYGGRSNGLNLNQIERTNCSCSKSSSNSMYCEEWNCTENTGTGHETEAYTCLDPPQGSSSSAEYCRAWKGKIFSDDELESSVCNCTVRDGHWCLKWQCQERGVVRCSKLERGWCSLEYSVKVGGVAGGFIILVGACISSIFETRRKRFVALAALFAFGCLPLVASVLIWGGVVGLVCVVAVWATALLIGIVYIQLSTHEEVPQPTTRKT